MTDKASIAAAADRIHRESGRLDLLVQNAAISTTATEIQTRENFLEDYVKANRASTASLDEVRAIWETNVFGVLAVYQAMMPLLRQSADARIVNVSSGVGSLALNADPAPPLSRDVRPGLPPRPRQR